MKSSSRGEPEKYPWRSSVYQLARKVSKAYQMHTLSRPILSYHQLSIICLSNITSFFFLFLFSVLVKKVMGEMHIYRQYKYIRPGKTYENRISYQFMFYLPDMSISISSCPYHISLSFLSLLSGGKHEMIEI